MTRNFTISSRLVNVLVVFFCAGLLFMIWYNTLQQLRYSRETTITEAINRNNNLVVALEQYAIRTIYNANAILQIVKMEYEDNAHFSYAHLQHNVSAYEELFDGLAIIDSSGSIVFASYPLPGGTLRFSDRAYFLHHKQHASDAVYISKPLQSRTIGKGIIVISKRIDRPDGSFGGVVALQIQPSTFTLFYSGAELRKHDIISLIAPDGTTYARRTGAISSHGENIIKSPLFNHVAQQPVGHYFARDAIRGIPTYFSFRKLHDFPMIATVGSAEDDVLADFRKQARNDYINTGLTSLMLVLFSVLISMAYQYRKKNIRRLQESEWKYRSMFEHSKDAIILFRGDGEVVTMNDAAYAMLRLEKDGEDVNMLQHIVNREGVDLQSLPEEITLRRQDGSSFTAEIASAPYERYHDKKVIIAIFRDTTERRRLQQQVMKEKKKLQEAFTRQVILAQEREREAIGRELHDNVNQVLTTVKLYLDMSLKDPALREQFLPKSMQLVNSSISEIRNLSHQLSAPTLGTKSLVDSINALIENVRNTSGLRIHFYYQTYIDDIVMEQKLAIYRIVQEQLNNIYKHAKASDVVIILRQEKSRVQLSIQDNGQGFDTSGRRKGIGLNNIESRVKAFSGGFSMSSAPGKGCRLSVHFPYRKKGAAASQQQA